MEKDNNDMTNTRVAPASDVTMAWPAKFARQSDGSWLVTFRHFPFAATEGGSETEAMVAARDCLDEAVAGTIAHRETIPQADAPKRGERLVPLDASLAFKALLYMVMEENGITKVDLAARLDVDEKEVRRMLDPAHRGTRIARYEAALAACGFVAEVSARPLPGTEAA